jgi:hypothetical protein
VGTEDRHLCLCLWQVGKDGVGVEGGHCCCPHRKGGEEIRLDGQDSSQSSYHLRAYSDLPLTVAEESYCRAVIVGNGMCSLLVPT